MVAMAPATWLSILFHSARVVFLDSSIVAPSSLRVSSLTSGGSSVTLMSGSSGGSSNSGFFSTSSGSVSGAPLTAKGAAVVPRPKLFGFVMMSSSETA